MAALVAVVATTGACSSDSGPTDVAHLGPVAAGPVASPAPPQPACSRVAARHRARMPWTGRAWQRPRVELVG
jgi:hypothetical protein